MKLNEKKTKNMIFNFTKKFQFTTKLAVNDKPIEIVKEPKLLGTILTEDLKWDKHTSEMVKSALDVMAICSISPRGQMQFCERVELPDDTKSVAFNILLGKKSYSL